MIEKIIDILDLLNNNLYNIKNVFFYENSKRIVIKQYIESKYRFEYVKYISNKINIDKNLEYTELLTIRSSKDFSFYIKGIDKLIYVIVKPLGKRPNTNCHEFLTACMTLLGIKDVPKSIEEVNYIYSLIPNLIKSNKIYNYTMKEVNLIEYDYNSLCQSISASSKILDILNNEIPQIAYLTGAGKWINELLPLNVSRNNIKRYNCSDIIFKINNHYTGISLKKKCRISDKDPTLLNKSLLSLFNNHKRIKHNLENIISSYFIDMMNNKNDNPIHYNLNNWKRYISDIDINYINSYIKDDKCVLWKQIRSILYKYSDKICKQLLDIVLRLELNNVSNFSFFIVSGIGKYYSKKSIFSISKAECYSAKDISFIYDNYIKDSQCYIKRNKEKESINQSTLFLTIFSNDIPIIDLEIRYKGRFSCSPEVLAFFTNDFKLLINNITNDQQNI